MARGKKRDAEDLTDGAVVAKSLQSKQTKTSTKRTYQSKVSIMIAWLATHFPETIDTNTNKMQIPLSNDAVLAFFGHICSPAHLCDRDNLDSKSATSIPLSVSCIWGYRSALIYVYRSKLLELDTTGYRAPSRPRSYEKVINDLKKRGLLKINEGKHQLKASGYGLLALKLMTMEPMKNGQTWSTVLFGWCFLLLMRNLMGRADSVDTIMLQHIEWSDTASLSRNRVTKVIRLEPRSLASTYTPIRMSHHNAQFLLALYIISRAPNAPLVLFLGSDSKYRFGRILRRAISALSDEEMHSLSCIRESIGTHSLLKGSGSYALSQVNGPTPVSVYLRMGQSLGKLND
ncbi:Hypothetical protein PHPALM_10027, partial [Phytophthora palmivora]